MREIRLFSSEGGGTGMTGPPYPYPNPQPLSPIAERAPRSAAAPAATEALVTEIVAARRRW
jgi:hypothetical protein